MRTVETAANLDELERVLPGGKTMREAKARRSSTACHKFRVTGLPGYPVPECDFPQRIMDGHVYPGADCYPLASRARAYLS